MKTNFDQPWECYNPIHISLPQAQYVLTEAQKSLASLNELANRITQRAYTILAILIGTSSFLYSFIWGKIITGSTISLASYWPMVLAILLVIYPFINIIKLIFPRDVYPNGRRPRDIVMEDFQEIPEEYREQAFHLTEIKHFQSVIDLTEYQNIVRTSKFKRTLTFLVIYALSILFALLVYSTLIG